MKAVTPENFFETAKSVATHYGFISTVEFFKQNQVSKKQQTSIEKNTKNLSGHKSDVSNILHFLFTNNISREEPILLYHSNIEKNIRKTVSGSKKKSSATFTLSIACLEDSFAEILLLSCAFKILDELKMKDNTIILNSMGDRPTSAQYFNKLHQAIRKNMDGFTRECIDECRRDICEAHKLIYNDEHKEMHDLLPSTLRMLNENAKIHLQTLIEYLDAHKINYQLSPGLVEPHQHCVHTLFKLSTDSEFSFNGGRLDPLSITLYKRKINMVSLEITLNKKISGNYIMKKKRKTIPKIFFLHAGYSARLHSLPTLAKLYDNKLCVEHRLYKKSVSVQLETINSKKIPYTIILGQEEVKLGHVCLKHNKSKESTKFNIIDEIDKIKKQINLKK